MKKLRELLSFLRIYWPLVLLAFVWRLLFAFAATLTLLGWLVFGWQFGAGAAAGFVMVMVTWVSDGMKREAGVDPMDLRVRWLRNDPP